MLILDELKTHLENFRAIAKIKYVENVTSKQIKPEIKYKKRTNTQRGIKYLPPKKLSFHENEIWNKVS